MKKIKLLFVCMGNICRSPTADAVMQHLVNESGLQDHFIIDSAGTHAYHIGKAPDARTQNTSLSNGISMAHLQARKISVNDYDEFDYIFAMDEDNLELIEYYAPSNIKAKISLFLSIAQNNNLIELTAVPDPYYGGEDGFDTVFSLVETGCKSLLQWLITEHKLAKS